MLQVLMYKLESFMNKIIFYKQESTCQNIHMNRRVRCQFYLHMEFSQDLWLHSACTEKNQEKKMCECYIFAACPCDSMG